MSKWTIAISLLLLAYPKVLQADIDARILGAPEGSPFHNPRSHFTQVFKNIIDDMSQSPPGFNDAYNTFRHGRAEVAQSDCCYEIAIQLRENNPVDGPFVEGLDTTVKPDGKYRGLYHMLKTTFRQKLLDKKLEKDRDGHLYWSHGFNNYEIFRVVYIGSCGNGIDCFKIIPTRKNRKEIWDAVASHWTEAVKNQSSPEKVADAVARFEFYFIGPNLPGRAAAAIGYGMSLVLQAFRRLCLPSVWDQLDFKVLSARDENTYREQRRRELTACFE